MLRKRSILILALAALILIVPTMLAPPWFVAKYGKKLPPLIFDPKEPVPLALDIWGANGKMTAPIHMPRSFER